MSGGANAMWVEYSVDGKPSVAELRGPDPSTQHAGAGVGWGDKLYGQLGNGTTTHRSTPGQVPGFSL
ncbi:MAG TPA: RCC1 domain-containing protein [Archangium sp.]|nr:RCC1 domain-containing protein [Archangium sp.]